MTMTYEQFVALDNGSILTPAEVAGVFRVDPKTVTRWEKAGKIAAIRTIGGHRRFRKLDVLKAMHEAEQEAQVRAEETADQLAANLAKRGEQ